MMVNPAGKGVQQPGYLQVSTLVMIAFCSAFFPRVLMLIKFPSIVNLAHLGIVPLVFALVLIKTRVKDKYQIAVIWQLVFALSCFLGVNLASALNNDAGVINAFVNFLLLCEHFLLLVSIVCLPLNAEKLIRLRALLLFASFTNTIFAYAQRYVFRLHLRPGLEDNIKGVFIGQGAGHVVGASVAVTFGLYYAVTAKNVPVWVRGVVLVLALQHMNMADAKQVLLVFALATGFLVLTKFKDLVQAIQYILVSVVSGITFFWAIQNIPALRAFNTWIRPEIYGPEGEATLLKSATFRIVPTYYDSWIDPLLGLGPGHTVGRLGGWMIREYAELLIPLGATFHPVTGAIWRTVGESWLGNQSSMFSPLFGWAGIWGDLGIIGLGSFLYIWWLVWRHLCRDDISRFIVLSILSFGLIFSQMEEPGYMLYVISLVGIQWHEHRLRQRGELPQELEQPPKLLPRTLKCWYRLLLRLP